MRPRALLRRAPLLTGLRAARLARPLRLQPRPEVAVVLGGGKQRVARAVSGCRGDLAPRWKAALCAAARRRVTLARAMSGLLAPRRPPPAPKP